MLHGMVLVKQLEPLDLAIYSTYLALLKHPRKSRQKKEKYGMGVTVGLSF